MPRDYVASTFKVICLCKAHVTVRTKEHEKKTPCWNCGRTIKIIMGMGRGNYRCTIIDNDESEYAAKVIHLDQG